MKSDAKLIPIIQEILLVDGLALTDMPVNIQYWDSLNHMRIVVKINEVYNLSLEPIDISLTSTLKEIIEVIENEKKNKI